MMSMAYVLNRYQIGIDFQIERCIPFHQIYLIDKWDRLPIRGAYYAFRSKGLMPLYEDGIVMLKIASGIPGDEVHVTEDLVTINHQPITRGMALAEKLSMTPKQFVRTQILNQAEYWFSGLSELSFDSRYWGTVQQDLIIGRARPIW